ncbi:MAG: RIP metalloprotease RseP [Candidatus Cloacimonetes bacterium]|nr:RIP metalloprotease RseP [Candidatus Cloacimonadota bacterium]
MNILMTLIVLGILIFVHELGHFLVARHFKVHIDAFSIGFGPKIFSFTKNGTLYKLSLIPIGGFVKMKEDEIETSNNDIKEVEKPISLEENFDINKISSTNNSSFQSKKWWERALIVFGGPAFNLLFAMLLIFITFFIGRTYSDLSPIISSVEYPYNEYFQQGDRIKEINNNEIRSWMDIYSNVEEGIENVFNIENNILKILGEQDSLTISKSVISIFIDDRIEFFNTLLPLTTNIVGDVTPGMPAWRAGIRTGDRILMINGVETQTWNDVRNGIMNSVGEAVVMTIYREPESSQTNESTFDLTVYPEINPLLGENARVIGITQHLDLTFSEKYSFFESIKYGVFSTISIVSMNYHALFKLAQNPSAFKNNVGGPIMVYYMTAQTTQRGFTEMLFFMAAISILLMIMNLLPIPVFDGGHIMFFLYEGIVGKPIPLKFQIVLQQIGILILVTLMIFAFYSDISRMWFLN